MPPFVATDRHRLANAAPASVTINMANLATTQPGDATKSKVETLFGPPVGVGGTAAPEWTSLVSKEDAAAGEEDELTMDVVQEWVKRSKDETSKPVATTTLQALVNLKRPSIRLTPLSSTAPEETPSTNATAHGLEFDFDCDAARCGITVRAVVPDDSGKLTLISLFDQATNGGFGKTFKFDEHGAVLELDKLDVAATSAPEASASHPEASTTAALSPAQPTKSKRFSAFHFRRRSIARDAVGPALQVVDADAEAAHPPTVEEEEGAASTPAAGTSKVNEVGEDVGVKIVIRLEALDEQGKPLKSRNAQLTYLHIIRMSTATAHEGEAEPVQKPWVVKVVKREAVIGTHTFRLQEIYGLASSTTSTAPAADAATTYPPSAPNTSYDGPATECVLCLSSPREVVLLPCRHLVACRECAVNMVEFGAGGVLTHEAEATTAAAAENADTPTGETPAAAGDVEAAAAAAPVAAPERPRRKRKAKGWFCPVCRQPYTALLRITTAPPGKRLSEDSFSHPPIAIPAPAVVAEAPAESSGGVDASAGRRGLGGLLSGLMNRTSGGTPAQPGEGAQTRVADNVQAAA